MSSAAAASRCWPSTSIPRATSRTTSTSRRGLPTVADVLLGRATARQPPRRHHPLEPPGRRGRAGAGGQDGPGADPAPGAARGRRRLRRDPHRLPARAGPAGGQRAGGGRPRAAQRRGPVLRAAGRRAGPRGHRARPRRPQPRPQLARRGLQHRRHANRALARGLRVAEGARRREAPADDGRQSIAYAESAERAISILDHRPDLGADYVALAEELLERLGFRDARDRVAALA